MLEPSALCDDEDVIHPEEPSPAERDAENDVTDERPREQ
jgi:hypothetical protein